jgi:serine/threonine-protein kinase
MTETGMSLGTPFYMSPEQAMGEREITAKSDVYALGCVTYEMLVGEPPFMGPTAQAIIARVMTEAPRSLQLQRHTIPTHVEAAIRRALEKLPADRFQSAAEFATALNDPSYASRITVTTVAQGASPRGARRWALPAALGAIVLLGALALWGWLRPAPPRPVARFSVKIPEDQSIATNRIGSDLALSADGQNLVYVGRQGGDAQLWSRRLDQLEATPIPGTAGAYVPELSPDGKSVAFTVSGPQLRIASLTGGPPITLLEQNGATPSWGSDGFIYVTGLAGSGVGIRRVPATGGEPETMTTIDTVGGVRGHSAPEALPGGRGVVFTINRGDLAASDIAVIDLKTRKVTTLLRGTFARYMTSGHLLYTRSDGALFAVPFDERRLVVTSAPIPILEGLDVDPIGMVDLAISRNGTLAYLGGRTLPDELVWVDREGREQQLDSLSGLARVSGVALSRDGNRLALSATVEGNEDVWLYDLVQKTLSRLTFASESDWRPIWEPDGKTITYVSMTASLRSLWRVSADGSSQPSQLFAWPGEFVQEASWAPDGKTLAIRVGPRAGTGRDIGYVVPGRDSVPTILINSKFDENTPRVSPDGKWLAYASDESGKLEIYVRPFPEGGGRWQVSTDGGSEPLWSRRGDELFYRSGDQHLMAAQVHTTPPFSVGSRVRLFSTANYGGDVTYTRYDVTPDGRRFIFARQPPSDRDLIVVLNWAEELKRRSEK